MRRKTARSMRFNPCFDGSVARGELSIYEMFSAHGFNPCFDGSVARA